MALVTTTGSLIRQYNAFTGLSALERSQSGIARAEVVYYNVNDTWAASGAGDYRLYQTGNIELPKDFGYVLTDARIMLTSDSLTTIRTEAAARYTLYPGGILGPQIQGLLASKAGKQNGTGTTAIGDIAADSYNSVFPISGDKSAIIYELENAPKAIIYPFGANAYTTASNPASLFNFEVGDHPTAQPAVKVTSYFRFLQYDIDQSYNYVIQSPQLTR